MKMIKKISLVIVMAFVFVSCDNQKKLPATAGNNVKLITLDPGHFHAALVQKSMYPEVDKDVHVYAPQGNELNAHLKLIESYNSRKDNPTSWNEIVYTGTDYLTKMLTEKKGNLVILAGNNAKKTDYIFQSVNAGLNVLSDKPMAKDKAGFELLSKAFQQAQKNKVLLYDIMTERYEINSILQKELSLDKNVFGELEKGSVSNPAVVKESVHHFFKYVSGAPLVRPAWYYDVEQQGEGLVDVTTHLVDLIQWACFPDQVIDYKKDIQLLSAKRWATPVTLEQYTRSTNQTSWPAYLQKDVKNNVLQAYANGEMNYTLKGVHSKVSVIWNYMAPEGTGDTHYSVMRGTKSDLIIKQGKEENYKPELYVQKTANISDQDFENILRNKLGSMQQSYPGISIKKAGAGWQIVIPASLRTTHEEHFAQVTRKYLGFLKNGKMPAWEVPNMIAKYYTITMGLEKAKQTN